MREALIRLAQEGLIDVFPQHGSFISKISETKIVEGLFVRQTLELAVLRKAAERWTAENTLAVATMLVQQRLYVQTVRPSRLSPRGRAVSSLLRRGGRSVRRLARHR